MGFPSGSVVKNLPSNAGDVGFVLGLGDPMEGEMVIHASILIRKTPWADEPGRHSSWGLNELDMAEYACMYSGYSSSQYSQ